MEDLVLRAGVAAAAGIRRSTGKHQLEPMRAGGRQNRRGTINRPVLDQAATILADHHPREAVGVAVAVAEG